ncbi:TetR/AcrR family transcriptional regulator [Cryobacterium sp. TMT1-21]|uniref:TetR/AcrR family transcriptional regulator n=1 Tax=Cryobacterium shii TaxID=1259235 RepID=A0AAQ2HFR8_9MICO|nr:MULTISPECIES: TetR/AcrR family transcriptional regulator [Cryobacterium]TFC48766.1 TetR/AcrR family transcriptional regulator [Cryobacterium shii]TFC81744.1 TetR/AcrR family transcriptional regulator [Cryobacterium sp. TmT2-59]TFD17563.1 TetR/AcrR family transcriptional regulator [Cryobacterium sp. TMT4-10]TFD18273.1 TetR/AcrR family transcriptional regulator [Cryobacterium sp. TMT1-21]TFD24833.1 TetR/AcrR family transcriptional regulator [Cryobacterium sp. TMT2-23]
MNARGDTTRKRLIDATTALVREVGYANVRTRSIAVAAGVAEGTLYRHFADKRSLFYAAVLDRNAPIVAATATLPSLAGRGTVLENLLEVIRKLAQLQEDLLPLEQAMIADPTLAPLRGERVQMPLEGPPHDIARYLAAEQSLGRVRAECDPTLAAISLLAMLFGLAVHPLLGNDLANSELLGASVSYFVDGVGAPATQPKLLA